MACAYRAGATARDLAIAHDLSLSSVNHASALVARRTCCDGIPDQSAVEVARVL